MRAKINIQQGDCLELMPKIEDKSIDMILADLPYGTTACKWDIVIPFESLWKQYKRTIKDNGAIVLFGSEPFSSHLRLSNIKQYRYDWIWHKNIGGGFALAKKQPLKRHEIISVFYLKQPTYNPIMGEYSDSTKKRFKNGEKLNTNAQRENKTGNIFNLDRTDYIFDFNKGTYPTSVKYFKRPHTANNKSIHPTQKPVKLMEYLIKTYTNENDLVLDNVMGSGTTGIACINLNRDFIGMELDKDYFEIAKKRINTHKAQLRITY